MRQLNLSLEQYETLAALARLGAATPDKRRTVDAFLRDIEKGNEITRHYLVVQWEEAGTPLPAGTVFPTKWPPSLRASIERTDRPIAKADVEGLLRSRARRPVEIMVTTDPGGELGWTPYDAYFRG